MATSKTRSAEELARLGIHIEAPEIEIPGNPQIDTTVAAEPDLNELFKTEAFMADWVRIRVQTTTDQNAPPQAIITVNDVNNRAVIDRGTPTWVRRMHVEVLARMRETRYTQPHRNMDMPEVGNQLIARSAMVYPFEVLQDPHPKGREWLERVLAEAN